MSKHVDKPGKKSNGSFKAASLKLEPSLIAIACHLAQIAADRDYEAFKNGQIPYAAPEQKGGPA